MDTSRADVLAALVRETMVERDGVEDELRSLSARMKELNAERVRLTSEVQVLERALERVAPSPSSSEPELDLDIDPAPAAADVYADDWSDLGRSHAVQLAVELLTQEKGFGTPAEVEETLMAHGWNLARDNVGAALSYLRLHGKIIRKRRGEWATAPRPMTTAEVSTP